MKIVQFGNGKYALRRFSIWSMRYEYKDLYTSNNSFWWSKKSRHFNDCLADSEGEVREKANLFEVVKEIDV